MPPVTESEQAHERPNEVDHEQKEPRERVEPQVHPDPGQSERQHQAQHRRTHDAMAEHHRQATEAEDKRDAIDEQRPTRIEGADHTECSARREQRYDQNEKLKQKEDPSRSWQRES